MARRLQKKKQLGERVKELRQQLHLNQKEIAEASGVTQATISRLESGAVKQLKSHALSGLAKALGISVDHLLGKNEPQSLTTVHLDSISPDNVFRTSDPVLNRVLDVYLKLDKARRRQLMEYAVFLSKVDQ
jgi:transcriptional regulator with XRE-family HTH domain